MQDKVNAFFLKYNYKPLDYDNSYGYQCMDLYHYYVTEVLPGFPHPPQPGAAWLWNNYDSQYYERIENTITAVPKLGDILIWGTKAGGGFGHVAIYKEGNVFSFTSFDQNWPAGSYCHFQGHNYFGGLLGWIRPKQQNVPSTDEQKEKQIRDELARQDTSTNHINKIKAIVNA
jgi:hypothetical protein